MSLFQVNPQLILRGISKTITAAFHAMCITHHTLWYSLVHWSVGLDCFLITSELLPSLLWSGRVHLIQTISDLFCHRCGSEHDYHVHIRLNNRTKGENEPGVKHPNTQVEFSSSHNQTHKPANQSLLENHGRWVKAGLEMLRGSLGTEWNSTLPAWKYLQPEINSLEVNNDKTTQANNFKSLSTSVHWWELNSSLKPSVNYTDRK